MPFIYYAPESQLLGPFEELKAASAAQDKKTRAAAYKLLGSISDDNPLKSIINEMQHVTAPFIERINDAVAKSNDAPFISAGHNNASYYILEQSSKLLVFCISIATLGEDRNRVGFSAYSAELELQGENIMISNQLHQLEFSKGAAATIKDEAIKKVDGVSFASPLALMVQVHQYMSLTALDNLSSIEKEALIYSLQHEFMVANDAILGMIPELPSILAEMPSGMLIRPFTLMLQAQKYMDDGGHNAFAVLRSSCLNLTVLEKKALVQYLRDEIKSIANSTDDDQKELLKKRLIQIFSITADLPGMLREKYTLPKEQELLEECSNKFGKRKSWRAIKAAGLAQYYKPNKKYTVIDVCSRLMPLLLSLITALKMHVMQYCILHIPLALTFASGITLASSYIFAMSVVSSLAFVALVYIFLGYMSDEVYMAVYSNDVYMCYKKFCDEVSFKEILYDIVNSFNAIINDISHKINAGINNSVLNVTKHIKSHYEVKPNKPIPKVLELKDLILYHSAIRLMQNLMLAGSLLCLLLPAYQLSCSITMLASYVIFSYGWVIPNKSKITSIIGPSKKATAAIDLVSCITRGDKAYNNAAEFLGYAPEP